MRIRTQFLKDSLFVLFLSLVVVSCETDKKDTSEEVVAESTLFNLLPSERTGITFVNKVENQKDFNIFRYRNFYNGGGVAIGDINND
ncbi:MAG: hypothetical protein AAF361_08745, partial [Bacteroidota bacterium]